MDGFMEGYLAGHDGDRNDGWGGNGAAFLWILVILAMFGFGRNGWGNQADGMGGFTGGYDLGKLATTNDVASGFSTSTIMGNQNDIKLALQTGFAAEQQTMCQGFSGINQAINTTGYETRDAITRLGYQLQNCCCENKQLIADLKYQMATDTCSIIQAGNANTQRIIDHLTQDKIASLQADNAALTAQLANNAQTNAIVSAIRPTPVPAYPVFSPLTSFAYPSGVTFGVNPNNYGCNCGCGV